MPSARLSSLVVVIVAVFVAVGCGSSGSSGTGGGHPNATAATPAAPPGASVRPCEEAVAGIGSVRVTGIDCDAGEAVVRVWARKPGCSSPARSSRFSCTVQRGYRCLGAATERGISVSCSRPGSSIAFVARGR